MTPSRNWLLLVALACLMAAPAPAQIDVLEDGRLLMLDAHEKPGYGKAPIYVRSGKKAGEAFGRYALHVQRYGSDDDVRAALLEAGGGSNATFALGAWITSYGGSSQNTGVFASGRSSHSGATLMGGSFEGKAEGRDQFVYAVYGKATKNYGLDTEGSTFYGGYFEAPGHGGSWAGWFDGRVRVDGELSYTGALVQVSDGRLKKDVRGVDGALGKLKRLKAHSYEFRHEDHPGMRFAKGRRYGLVAQEVEAVFPELVTEIAHVTAPMFDEEGRVMPGTGGVRESWKAVSYTELIPVLLAGLQEQQALIEALQAEVEALKRGRRPKN